MTFAIKHYIRRVTEIRTYYEIFVTQDELKYVKVDSPTDRVLIGTPVVKTSPDPNGKPEGDLRLMTEAELALYGKLERSDD